MKLYAPKYYKDFRCVADRCRHSCCIGWEIDVDADTLERYRASAEGYLCEVGKSIDMGETPHFRLLDGDRCPHLTSNGLCRMITELGEEYLCDICREHPRFYNQTAKGQEVGLGIACEEACRIVLSSDDYGELVEVGESEGALGESELDTLTLRQGIYGILSDRESAYTQRLQKIYRDFGVSPALLTDGEWRELIASLEYMDDRHRELFLRYFSKVNNASADVERKLERALAYFIFRHCTEARDETEYRAALGFCLFCERLLASVAAEEEDFLDVARIISEEIEYSEENTENIKNEIFFRLDV